MSMLRRLMYGIPIVFSSVPKHSQQTSIDVASSLYFQEHPHGNQRRTTNPKTRPGCNR